MLCQQFPAPLRCGFTALLCFSLFSCNGPETKITDNKKPDDNRFTAVVLTQMGDFDEPMNFEVLKDGKVYINERKGALKMFDPVSKTVTVIGTIPVNTKYTSAAGVVTEAEEGFMGFTVDPQFEKNLWAYLFYAHPTVKKDVLSRWKIIDDKLVPGSEKVLLEIPTQREVLPYRRRDDLGRAEQSFFNGWQQYGKCGG